MKTNLSDNNMQGFGEEENPFAPLDLSHDEIWDQEVRNIIGEEFFKDLEGDSSQDVDNNVKNKEEE